MNIQPPMQCYYSLEEQHAKYGHRENIAFSRPSQDFRVSCSASTPGTGGDDLFRASDAISGDWYEPTFFLKSLEIGERPTHDLQSTEILKTPSPRTPSSTPNLIRRCSQKYGSTTSLDHVGNPESFDPVLLNVDFNTIEGTLEEFQFLYRGASADITKIENMADQYVIKRKIEPIDREKWIRSFRRFLSHISSLHPGMKRDQWTGSVEDLARTNSISYTTENSTYPTLEEEIAPIDTIHERDEASPSSNGTITPCPYTAVPVVPAQKCRLESISPGYEMAAEAQILKVFQSNYSEVSEKVRAYMRSIYRAQAVELNDLISKYNHWETRLQDTDRYIDELSALQTDLKARADSFNKRLDDLICESPPNERLDD